MPFIACPICRIAKKSPHQAAIIENNQIISYAELNTKIENYKNSLKQKGVAASTRVAILNQNSSDYIALLFALWRLKAVACVLNTRNPIRTINSQLKQIKSKLIVSDHNKLLNFKNNQMTKSSFTYRYPLNQPATIMFTSGSAATPKAALHSIGNHYYNALGSNENIKLKKEDRWLLSLPLYHVSGMGIVWRSFIAGSTVVISNPNKNLIQTIKKYSITHLSLVTTQLQTLIQSRQEFPQLKAILVGGSAIPLPLIQSSLNIKLPIHISYGLTEMASQVATSQKLTKAAHPQAKILKYRQIKTNVDGEILVKGRTLFQGYVHGNRLIKPFDKQGWFHSGDLGIMNTKNYVRIIGRKDNMFISGGENIQPEEIEQYLMKIKEIEKAIVLPLKDKQFGYRPISVIQWKTIHRLSTNQLIRKLQQELPKYKIPIQFISWPQKIKMGMKINRQELKKHLRLI